MPGANGLYGHIRNNFLKSALLLSGFVVLIGLYWWAGCLSFIALMMMLSRHRLAGLDAQGAFFEIADVASRFALAHWYVPVAIASVWFLIAWLFHRRMIQAATGARPLERREAPKLYNLVENLAITAGLPMPRIEVIETLELNAYAAGLTPATATIAVTRGLMETLTKDELEAVLAHEMTHIKNRDVQLMVVALIFAGGIALIGDFVGSFFGRGSGGGNVTFVPGFSLGSDDEDNSESRLAGAAILGAILALVVGLIVMGLAQVFAILSQFALSRSREYLADAGAVELTKNPDALISALLRISQNDEVPLASEGLRAMMISRHFDSEDMADKLMSTHPAISDRVASLERYAGGRAAPLRPVVRPLPAAAAASRPSIPMMPVVQAPLALASGGASLVADRRAALRRSA